MKPQRALLTAACFLLLAPPSASAQKETFLDAFIEFHSALSGSYGDEGTTVTSALARMETSLEAWEQAQRQRESALKAQPGITPGELALFYAEEGRFDEAVRAMDDAIAAEPGRASLYLFQGFLHEAAGRPDRAQAAFRAAAQTAPADPVAAYLAAARPPGREEPDGLEPFVTSLMNAVDRVGSPRLRDPFLEFRLIRDASSTTPVFSPADYAEGFTLFARQRYREAVAHFKGAASRDLLVVGAAASQADAMKGIAALRDKQGDAAIEQLRAALETRTGSPEVHRLLGIAYRAIARLPEAIRHLEEAVHLAPDDERTRVTLGATLAEAGMLADAERVLRETVDAVPASGHARWALAGVYERLGRGLDAIATLEDATALTVVAGKAALFWRLAELQHTHQDYEGVVLTLHRRARLLPNEPRVHKDLGLAFSRLGRDNEALIELLATSLLGLEDVQTLTAVGQIHLSAERFEAAERVLRRAVALDPNSPQPRYALGTTLTRLGRVEEGREHLTAFQRLRDAALDEQRRKFESYAEELGK